jgi:D-tyrosyl-tRNA(Tyr) deacylase
MKVLVQRVRQAGVLVDGTEVASIGSGALLFIGVFCGDTLKDARHLAGKTAKLRIFNDEQGRLNCAIDAVSGSFLAVSQFTLCADCRKGSRPSYADAASPEEGRKLYDHYVEELRAQGHTVETGLFGANMLVELQNDGPVTVMLDSSLRRRSA